MNKMIISQIGEVFHRSQPVRTSLDNGKSNNRICRGNKKGQRNRQNMNDR